MMYNYVNIPKQTEIGKYNNSPLHGVASDALGVAENDMVFPIGVVFVS